MRSIQTDTVSGLHRDFTSILHRLSAGEGGKLSAAATQLVSSLLSWDGNATVGRFDSHWGVAVGVFCPIPLI